MRTGLQYRMLLDKFILPTFGDQRIDRITNEDVNAWYDDLAPGRETIRAQSYSLLRTIFASAASERPTPFTPYNPAHIRGAGSTRRAHQVQPATLAELETIVAELPDRYQLMALLAAWCAMWFGELTELRLSRRVQRERVRLVAQEARDQVPRRRVAVVVSVVLLGVGRRRQRRREHRPHQDADRRPAPARAARLPGVHPCGPVPDGAGGHRVGCRDRRDVRGVPVPRSVGAAVRR